MSAENMSDTKFHIYLLLSGLENSSYENILEYSMEAEKLIEKLPEEEINEDKIKLYSSTGNCYFNLEQYKEAVKNYEKVIECWIEYGSENQLMVTECLDLCGYSYAVLGDYEKFLDYGIKSCQIYTEQQNLSVEELEELKMLKGGLEEKYEESPMAEQQDFESWYKENTNSQNLKE